MPNIDKRLTNVGHRFVHQSGLDESSRHKSTFVRHRIALRIYLMFSKIDKSTTYEQICSKVQCQTYFQTSDLSVMSVQHAYILACFGKLLKHLIFFSSVLNIILKVWTDLFHHCFQNTYCLT